MSRTNVDFKNKSVMQIDAANALDSDVFSDVSDYYLSSDEDDFSTNSSPPPNTFSQQRPKKPKSSLFGRERKSCFQDVIKWPLLVNIHFSTLFVLTFDFQITIAFFILIDLIAYIFVSVVVRLYESCLFWRGIRRNLLLQLMRATTYSHYRNAAMKLDNHFNNNAWKDNPSSEIYDWRLVSKVVRKFKNLRTKIRKYPDDEIYLVQAIKELLLHGACKPNLGGVEQERLYSQTYYGSKNIVEEYVNEVESALVKLSETSHISADEKFQLFKWISLNFGKSALCLSGGGTLGYHHLGVVRALLEENMLPKIISGTSCGSLMAALICVRTDEELRREILVPDVFLKLTANSESWFIRLSRLYSEKQLFSFDDWYEKIKIALGGNEYEGNITFMEAYKRTGRILNISVVPDEPYSYSKQLNYITSPDVVIATATIASSAVPGFLKPIQLLMKTSNGELIPYKGAGKRWRDGSLRSDISHNELKQLWNVNFSIVSQVNPHVVPFFFFSRGMPGSPSAHRHGKGWRGGFLASALIHHFRLDLQKWLRFVREMDLMPRILGSDVSSIWLQTFHGECTIMPRISIRDYGRILDDPKTRENMQHYLDGGMQGAWSSLHMIENRIRIERVISAGLRNSRNLIISPDLKSFPRSSHIPRFLNRDESRFDSITSFEEQRNKEELQLESYHRDTVEKGNRKRNSRYAADSDMQFDHGMRKANAVKQKTTENTDFRFHEVEYPIQ
ncbi:hypothetical protein HK096_003119 [Nowakowskiella sp. JEL0078]|nr:hypothetical protein HK096_003119 [Nowakowskiella sp. JEL0078]